MLESFVERLVEADHHRRRCLQPGLDDRALRLEVVRDGVLPFRMAPAKVLSQDLAASSGHPVHACVTQAPSRIRVRRLRSIREEYELGDRQRVELDALTVALA